jgi:hypothetical protein
MKASVLLLAALAVACAGDTEEVDLATNAAGDTLAKPTPPPAPIGLYGEWLRVSPPQFAGDTLRLAPDSTAAAIIPWAPDTLARITRWKLVYGSRDPIAEREDWREDHRDGGDFECSFEREPDPSRCRSLPLLCLGGVTKYRCRRFAYTPDSLLIHPNLTYVRLRPVRPPDTLLSS